MKLAIFGSTGRTGFELVNQALSAGHWVTAIVRDPARLHLKHSRLAITVADFQQLNLIEQAMEGQDAALSAVGAPQSRAPTEVHEVAARVILGAMAKTGVRRLMTVTSGGTNPQHDPNLPFVFENVFKRIYASIYLDQMKMEQVIMASSVDWTIVRPAALVDDPVSNRYRFAEGFALPGGRQTARADVAHFMINHVQDQATFHKGIAIAY